MAPRDVGCLFLAVLILASCEAIASSDRMCTEREVNRTYSCEHLGLSELPGTLPNSTEVLEFSFNFLPVIQNTTFGRLLNLTFLDLTRCQINWIREDTFQNHHQLSTLVLTANPLIFLTERAFSGPKSLRHLSLIQTGITSLEFLPVHNLDNLESLYLGSNRISSIQLPRDFPTEKLQILDFQNNAIRYLSRDETSSLHQATNLSLNLNGNDIRGIEPGAFRSTVFGSLNFGGSLDVSLILRGLQNSTVQSLWLGSFVDTDDQHLSRATLEGLCGMSVQSLSLQKHHFSELSSATFQCFSGLQELDLTATHLAELPAGIETMNLLKKLVLSANKFEDLCQIQAANFPSLTHLHLKGNMKRLHLGVGCLEKLENLRELDLSHNDIEEDCCNQQLQNLSHLQSLNLSYNEPLGLQTEAFKACPRLELLDLAFTHLRIRVPESPFQNLPFLRVLNLSHCLLDLGNQWLLDGLPSLRHLNLQGNHFADGSIPQANPLQTVRTLETLILASCALSSIHQEAFRGLEALSHVDLSHNSLTSTSIEALSHLKGIYLNVATNSISLVSPRVLLILSQQSTINLSHNPLDCSCSNIQFLTWCKENMPKLEDTEEMRCATPPSLRGARISDVTVSCGITAVGLFLLIVFLFLLVILFIFATRYFLRWKYQHL